MTAAPAPARPTLDPAALPPLLSSPVPHLHIQAVALADRLHVRHTLTLRTALGGLLEELCWCSCLHEEP